MKPENLGGTTAGRKRRMNARKVKVKQEL